MNTSNALRQTFAAALTAVIGLGFSVEASAQSVTTTPVGAVTVTIGVGVNPLAVNMLRPAVFSANVSAVNAAILTIQGQVNVGAQLAADEPYYIEIYSGALKGDRFDVDVPATISLGNGTLVVSASSANNTVSFQDYCAALLNAKIVLRKHITLSDIQAASSVALVGNNDAALADRVQLYDTESNSYTTYYLRSNGVDWRQLGSTQQLAKKPIVPGVGVFFTKQNSPCTLTFLGEVSVNDFALVWYSGNQLVSYPWPMDVSPMSLGATQANGWVGNNSFALADQIQVYNVQNRAYDTYFLRGDGLKWRMAGTTTEVTSIPVVASTQSFFVRRNTADDNYILMNPIN
ncbi:MAG: hypothetical protein WC205_07105 [Opitutaceae bacterium]|jgi:hypothetical protein